MYQDNIFIREDKNGTKIYHNYTCRRCGGAGGADQWKATGWTCYECGGSGIASSPEVIKVYTPEYEAILAERRAKRAEKKRQERISKAEELNRQFLKDHGFSEDGKIYAVLGDTYPIKDTLKALGCRWTNPFGWTSDHPLDDYPTRSFDVSQVWERDKDGVYAWWCADSDFIHEQMKLAEKKLMAPTNKSEYVYEVGQRIEEVVTITHIASFDTHFGWKTITKWIYTFANDEGTVFVWKTTSPCDRVVNGVYRPRLEGDRVRIRGTVKDHEEYRGVKQTVLQRVIAQDVP